MENVVNQNSTLTEVVADFLPRLLPQDREKTQAEVYKFVRWLGLHRKVAELSPADVASYGEQITPSAIKPVKSFLTYIWQKKYTKVNLSVHLRAKKVFPKVVAPRQSSQGQITLSAQGYAQLEAELAKLESQRSNVTEELRKAAADKDFRENAPLEAARERKARLEGRIQELKSSLKSAKIMGEGQGISRIKLGDTVVLYDLSSAKELYYKLVDPQEANPAKGRISVTSPLGKALLDKEKGEMVEVAAPAGTFTYRIEDIPY